MAKYYAGHTGEKRGTLQVVEIFTSKVRPTKESHGYRYSSVIGPFKDRTSLADYMGALHLVEDNPLISHIEGVSSEYQVAYIDPRSRRRKVKSFTSAELRKAWVVKNMDEFDGPITYKDPTGKGYDVILAGDNPSSIPRSALSWREKAGKGKIMRRSTFKRIEKSAEKAGYDDPKAVAGAAYWRTLRAKYREAKGNPRGIAQHKMSYRSSDGFEYRAVPDVFGSWWTKDDVKVTLVKFDPDRETGGRYTVSSTKAFFTHGESEAIEHFDLLDIVGRAHGRRNSYTPEYRRHPRSRSGEEVE